MGTSDTLFSYRRKSNFSSKFLFAFVLLVCIASWGIAYEASVGFPLNNHQSPTFLWIKMSGLLHNKEAAYSIGILLLFAGAFIIRHVTYNLSLIAERTRVPFLVYLLLSMQIVAVYPISPASVGVIPVIYAFYQLMSNYRSYNVKAEVFKGSFVISFVSLFWVDVLWLYPVFWMGMYLLIPSNFRTYMASFVGIITVYWGLLGWCVWTKDFSPFVHVVNTLTNISAIHLPYFLWVDWACIIFLLILTIMAFSYIMVQFQNNTQKGRQILKLLVLLSFCTLLLSLILPESSPGFLLITCFPISIIMSRVLMLKKGKSIRVTFYTSLIIIILLQTIRLWSIL